MSVAPQRLRHALQTGVLALPGQGRILAIGLPGDASTDWADAARIAAVQGFAPDHAALAARGVAVSPELPAAAGPAFAAALVLVPRARLLARLWIARAAQAVGGGGLLMVEGAKSDGIDGLWRDCRGRLAEAGSDTKAHGRVFWGRPAADFDDWITASCLPAVDGMQVAPGAFSADAVDPGSALLAAALPPALPQRVADLGAGWGWLSAQVLARPGVAHLDVVEADHAALSAARANLGDPRAEFHWADAVQWRPDAPVDAVVMNPPFHAGRRPQPELGRAFIATAAAALSPRGVLWLVANRHLPYEAELAARFGELSEGPGTPAFKILRAARPKRR